MSTYFISFLSGRVMDCLHVLSRLDIAPKKTCSDCGFTIIEVVCTEEQANAIHSSGFNVAEQ